MPRICAYRACGSSLLIWHPGRCLGAKVLVHNEKLPVRSNPGTAASHFYSKVNFQPFLALYLLGNTSQALSA